MAIKARSVAGVVIFVTYLFDIEHSFGHIAFKWDVYKYLRLTLFHCTSVQLNTIKANTKKNVYIKIKTKIGKSLTTSVAVVMDVWKALICVLNRRRYHYPYYFDHHRNYITYYLDLNCNCYYYHDHYYYYYY